MPKFQLTLHNVESGDLAHYVCEAENEELAYQDFAQNWEEDYEGEWDGKYCQFSENCYKLESVYEVSGLKVIYLVEGYWAYSAYDRIDALRKHAERFYPDKVTSFKEHPEHGLYLDVEGTQIFAQERTCYV